MSSDTLLVDFVGNVETMQSDMQKILTAIDTSRVHPPVTIPKTNQSSRGDIRGEITDEMADIIIKRYAADFKRFGYSTDPAHAYEPSKVIGATN